MSHAPDESDDFQDDGTLRVQREARPTGVATPPHAPAAESKTLGGADDEPSAPVPATASAQSAASAGTQPESASIPPTAPTATALPDLKTPSIFGDYELQQEIARGGMGVVYKARHRELNRVVALKMILDDSLGSTEALQRFRREAQAAAALDHPNIVAIHDSGSREGRSYFTMAYVEGPNLKEVVKSRGIPTSRETLRLMTAIAEGVAFAHQHGIIHRDLKPENVLVDAQGRPRITDFGVAKRTGPGDAALTASGQVLGTPSYMSPEQASCSEDLGPPSDVYSLGGILFFLLTGQAPFRGKSVTEVLAQVIMGQAPPPSQLNPSVPAELEAICVQCLQKDPKKRYSTAAALLEALRAADVAAAEESPDKTRPLEKRSGSRPTPALSWKPGGKTAAAPGRGGVVLAGVVAVVLLGGGIAAWATVDRWAWWKAGPQSAPAPEPAPPARAGFSLPTPDKVRSDFGLQVEMVATGGGGDVKHLEPDAAGVIRVEPGSKVRFRIKSEREAYVGVWTIEADGSKVQLFPNEKDPDYHFKAGEERVVPAQGAEPIPSPNTDQVWIEAWTEPWDLAKGEKEGPYELFKTQRDQEKWEERRGLRLRQDKGAERVLSYRVGDKSR
jgi:tRNA A-37 threonylcarbamoyl transferase component Bud32